MSVRIVADQDIPLAREALGAFGEVETAAGRAIDAAMVRDADALVVRSVTPVDADLLRASRVRFVATATIGTDHVDLGWLERRGIAFAYAPGCNALSVAEWVAAALLEIEASLATSLAGKVLGVVGVGNVGRRVVEKARALGLEVLCCDPPRAEHEGPRGFVSLERLLREADVVTLHTPLTAQGPHATYHRIGPDELARLRRGAILLNTARGPVVDGRALCAALERGRVAAAALDVWEGEPRPDPELVRRALVATPHVAGYSLDGKLAGTRMVAEALARFLGRPGPDAALFDVPLADPIVTVTATGRGAIRQAVDRARPLREDDRRMRALCDLPPAARSAAFDALRREYPVRRELDRYEVRGPALAEQDRAVLRALGFRCA